MRVLGRVLANADHLKLLWCMVVLAFSPVAQSLVMEQELLCACVRTCVGKRLPSQTALVYGSACIFTSSTVSGDGARIIVCVC